MTLVRLELQVLFKYCQSIKDLQCHGTINHQANQYSELYCTGLTQRPTRRPPHVVHIEAEPQARPVDSVVFESGSFYILSVTRYPTVSLSPFI